MSSELRPLFHIRWLQTSNVSSTSSDSSHLTSLSSENNLHLLTLWFNHGGTAGVQTALGRGFLHVNINTWKSCTFLLFVYMKIGEEYISWWWPYHSISKGLKNICFRTLKLTTLSFGNINHIISVNVGCQEYDVCSWPRLLLNRFSHLPWQNSTSSYFVKWIPTMLTLLYFRFVYKKYHCSGVFMVKFGG